MKINSLAELGEIIKKAPQVKYQYKEKVHKENLIGGVRDKQVVIYAQFDKNEQLCDIQPRNTEEVQTLFNQYKGRPYSLVCDELLSTFRDMISEKIV